MVSIIICKFRLEIYLLCCGPPKIFHGPPKFDFVPVAPLQCPVAPGGHMAPGWELLLYREHKSESRVKVNDCCFCSSFVGWMKFPYGTFGNFVRPMGFEWKGWWSFIFSFTHTLNVI